MFKKLLLVFGFMVIVVSDYAQNIEIRGQIIDKDSGKPVAEAHVITTAGTVAVTGQSGNFTLIIPGTPAIIRITHVAYGTIEYHITTDPHGLLVIRIKRKITDLDEIQVRAERLQILTRKDQFSIQEFAIDRHVIWMLGFINNQANRQRLFLANLYGDTLASIPVRRAESLFQDVFNNVHMVFKDSVYQIFHPKGDQIEFLYAMEKNRFFSIMEEIALAFNHKLVYSKELPGSFSCRIYFIQQDDPVQHQLAFMTDTLERNRQITTNKIDRLMAIYKIPELANMWKTIGRYTKRGTKFDAVIRHQIPYKIFQANNNLFIVNYLKDSLLRYSPDGKFEQALSIDFHKETFLAGTDYKDLKFITDPITQKVYLLERYMARWVLKPLNPMTGKTGAMIRIPDFPGMTGITVYSDAVYFIYQEKLYPYYNRLYRYQL